MDEINQVRRIRLSKSCLGDSEKSAVREVLDHEYLGMGSYVQQFEEDLSEFFGRPAICVANGTAALHLALQACGIGHGDEVLVQSLTYVASYQAISATGARPVSCDVDPSSLTIDLKHAENLITSRTKALMPVHYAGGVGPLDEIYNFASKHGLRIIEDAAHAFGSTYHGTKVGGFGDISCFSFDGIKNITCGEGGCVVSNDKQILDVIQDLRLLGVNKDTLKRFSGQRSWDFDVLSQGWRYHMSNMNASIGIVQLSRFPVLAQRRQSLAKLYTTLLSDCLQIIPVLNEFNEVVPHIYPVFLSLPLDRDLVRKLLLDAGVESGYHYQPNHKLSFYYSSHSLPITDSLSTRLLTLPLHPDLDDLDVIYVVNTLKSILANC